jgi:hypothetical protein
VAELRDVGATHDVVLTLDARLTDGAGSEPDRDQVAEREELGQAGLGERCRGLVVGQLGQSRVGVAYMPTFGSMVANGSWTPARRPGSAR